MESSQQLSIVAAGVFFLTGLLTGVWKYLQIRASEEAEAHPYVDIAHRSSLMYSFAARADTEAVDEPFYAAYLQATGADHPMADEIIAAGQTNFGAVIRDCLAAPKAAAVSYQKHMCHHLINGVDRSWITRMTNVFLIRHPARVLASYHAKRENPTLSDIAFDAQMALFEELCAAGQRPIVIDSATVRAAPDAALRALCGHLGLEFDTAMLRWPAGGSAADGVRAKHWYDAAWRSTGFAGAEGPLPDVAPDHRATYTAALPIYERLKAFDLDI